MITRARDILLEVVTRHRPHRAHLLRAQQESLDVWRVALAPAALVQTILVDPIGLGVVVSHDRLRTFHPCARYVWVLDDDDLACPDSPIPDRLREAAASEDPPDLIWTRCQWMGRAIPPDDLWEQAPQITQTGTSCPIVRRDLWLACRDSWGLRYEGDFDFCAALHRRAVRPVWWNALGAIVTEVNRGK